MRRAAIRQAFGLKTAQLLPAEVQIIWENTAAISQTNKTAWLYLGLVFHTDNEAVQILGHPERLISGALQGWLAVPVGSGMDWLDQLIDLLDSGLGQQHFDSVATRRLDAELPIEIPPYHKLHFSIPFTYSPPAINR